MKDTSRRARLAWSLAAWWLLLTLALWSLGEAVDQPAALPRCAASAALLVAVGELGAWLRRRTARRRG
ncbi:hypothetical protein [Streptomyces roseolilacinus]|uniref:Uncharacterized protein n=1 Tax=Streptomyces roseolilacinus TaxID=66904 RepID=A0A918B3C6_9ACTN|nr:hypothetical protein [Streptomyces roseolilacinus]GGQ20979.1 hypothetical protein GCM10010249_44540 [Streptomyces roseolilacinus]